MSVNDLAPGDLLYKILYPRSNEVRLATAEREVRKLRKYTPQKGGGPRWPRTPGGPDSESVGGSTVVPRVDKDSIVLSDLSTFGGDGVHIPRLKVDVATQWTKQVRGFLRFRVRATTGENIYEVDGPAYPESPTPGTILLPLTPSINTQTTTVQVQIVSDLYGEGPWSEPVSMAIGVDTTPPDPITGLSSVALPGGSRVTWDMPVDFDYSHTEVWLGSVSSATRFLGTAQGYAFEFTWDFTSFAILSYTNVWARAVDMTGNAGAWASTTVNKGQVANSDIANGAIDGTKLNSAISYTGVMTVGSGGQIKSSSGKVAITDTGLRVTANGTLGDQNIYFYGSDGGLIGTIYAYGDTTVEARMNLTTAGSPNSKLFMTADHEVNIRSLNQKITLSAQSRTGLTLNDDLLLAGPDGDRFYIPYNNATRFYPCTVGNNTEWWASGAAQTYISPAGALLTKQNIGFQLLTLSANLRDAGSIRPEWASSLDASRKGRLKIGADDATAWREALRVETDGTKAMLGFYGATAITKPTITGARSNTEQALANLLTQLSNLGLIVNSTTI